MVIWNCFSFKLFYHRKDHHKPTADYPLRRF